MKSPASFSRRAGWPRRPFKPWLTRPVIPFTQRIQSPDAIAGSSTHDSTAVARKLCRVERLGRADIADGLVVHTVDHAPENALRTHVPVLRVPRVRAFTRFAGEST